MSCPNCQESNVNLVRKKDDGQGFWEKEEYSCPNCACEWGWEMTKTITQAGKENY